MNKHVFLNHGNGNGTMIPNTIFLGQPPMKISFSIPQISWTSCVFLVSAWWLRRYIVSGISLGRRGFPQHFSMFHLNYIAKNPWESCDMQWIIYECCLQVVLTSFLHFWLALWPRVFSNSSQPAPRAAVYGDSRVLRRFEVGKDGARWIVFCKLGNTLSN